MQEYTLSEMMHCTLACTKRVYSSPLSVLKVWFFYLVLFLPIVYFLFSIKQKVLYTHVVVVHKIIVAIIGCYNYSHSSQKNVNIIHI